MMEFFIQKTSPIPIHKQLIEQIKIGLLLGELRPGEILPSIRDLEGELHISRNLVRKAYVELENAGILRLIHGKGVMVEKHLKYRENRQFLKNCEELVETTRKSCQSSGVVFSSFARFLHHRAIEIEGEEPPLLYVDMSKELAEDRAHELSKILNLQLRGWSVEQLVESKNEVQTGVKVVCNYYRLQEVSTILHGKNLDIVPLRMSLSERTRKELQKLPAGSRIMFIFDQTDKAGLDLILTDYGKMFADQNLEFVARFTKDPEEGVKKMVKQNQFAKVLVSNRLWKNVAKEIRQMRKVSRPIMDFDKSSIEEAKTQLGIIG
jgi:GntR family transcriptional regulator